MVAAEPPLLIPFAGALCERCIVFKMHVLVAPSLCMLGELYLVGLEPPPPASSVALWMNMPSFSISTRFDVFFGICCAEELFVFG